MKTYTQVIEFRIRLFAILMLALFLMANVTRGWSQGPAKYTPTRFTVVDEGTVGKPDVVLIPGLTSGREVWAAEAAKLAPNYRLHLVQVDGFAGQPAGANAAGDAILPAIVEELHSYIEASKMHPAVVGHSLGGLLALMLADKYPQSVAKMVIVDSLPFYGMMFGPQMTPAMVKPVAAQMRDKLEGPETPAVRADNSQKTAAALVLNPEGRKLVAQESLDSNPHVFGEAMYEDLQTDLRADLPNLKTKTLMLYPFDPTLEGPGGMHITQQMFDTLYMGAYKPMPNVTVVRVDGSRHFIMLDQPAKFDALLEAFLKG